MNKTKLNLWKRLVISAAAGLLGGLLSGAILHEWCNDTKSKAGRALTSAAPAPVCAHEWGKYGEATPRYYVFREAKYRQSRTCLHCGLVAFILVEAP